MRDRHAAGLLALLLHGSQRSDLLSVWSFMKSSIKLEQNLLASWSRHMRDFWNPSTCKRTSSKESGRCLFPHTFHRLRIVVIDYHHDLLSEAF